MMTDSTADMLTCIRNATRIERPVVDMPTTRFKGRIAQVLKEEGFIIDYHIGIMVKGEEGQPAVFQQQPDAEGPKALLRIYLKYGPEGQKVIRHIERISKPGCRRYAGYKDLRPVLDGLGIAVLSTSRGLMSDRRARTERVGGEVLCTIW